MVGDRFWDPFGKISNKVQKCCQICQKMGLENMELDGFWVVVAPFGLGLAVVRGIGPKFHYRPLFGHKGPPGAENGPFPGFRGHFGLPACPWPIVPIVPCWLILPIDRPRWAAAMLDKAAVTRQGPSNWRRPRLLHNGPGVAHDTRHWTRSQVVGVTGQGPSS